MLKIKLLMKNVFQNVMIEKYDLNENNKRRRTATAVTFEEG